MRIRDTKYFIYIVFVTFSLARAASLTYDAATVAKRLVPSGAELATVKSLDSKETVKTDSVACTISTKSGKVQPVAFVYSQNGILYLQIDGNMQSRTILPGSFVQSSSDIPGIACRDFTGKGVLDVAVITSEGASVGSELSIYALEESRLHSLLGSPAGFSELHLDCGAGACNLVCFGNWTNLENSFVIVYTWNGSLFTQTSAGVEDYKQQRTEKLVKDALSNRPLAVSYRALLTSRAMLMLSSQGQRQEATEVAEKALRIFDDPTLTVADEEQSRRGTSYRSQVEDSKKEVSTMLGEVNHNLGK